MVKFNITSKSIPNFLVSYRASNIFEALEMFEDEYGQNGLLRGASYGDLVLTDIVVEMVPEPTILISWYEHDCDFVTSFCDQNGHLKHAHIPERILHEYVGLEPKDK